MFNLWGNALKYNIIFGIVFCVESVSIILRQLRMGKGLCPLQIIKFQINTI